jgi:hypothetical protein
MQDLSEDLSGEDGPWDGWSMAEDATLRVLGF